MVTENAQKPCFAATAGNVAEDDTGRGNARGYQQRLSQGIAMSMVFRAADEPAASRPDYWRHVICERFRPMEVRFADGPGSYDELLTGVIGALRVTESTS